MRFALPQKARDDMYDVHPALNNNKEAPPKQEQRTEAPRPQPEKPKPADSKKKDDKKDDDKK
jgi:hypothetical protein